MATASPQLSTGLAASPARPRNSAFAVFEFLGRLVFAASVAAAHEYERLSRLPPHALKALGYEPNELARAVYDRYFK